MKYRTSLMSLGLLAASLTTTTPAVASQSLASVSINTTVSVASDAELDSLLAPIALYPDTLLTHILIASTYPLDVVAADRWRQANRHLSDNEIEQALEHNDWDPSVKALVPFTDILALMAEDLDWLSALGNAVMDDQARVLDHVQSLRSYAHAQGTLRSNDYMQVSRQQQVIVIAPRHHTQVYVPFYDTRSVFGHWHHHVAPVYWHYPSYARRHAGLHWSIGINLSSRFYFGSIHWQNRYVAISHEPVRHWRSGYKRVHSKAFQRWQPTRRHHRPVKRVISSERRLAVPHRQSQGVHARGNERHPARGHERQGLAKSHGKVQIARPDKHQGRVEKHLARPDKQVRREVQQAKSPNVRQSHKIETVRQPDVRRHHQKPVHKMKQHRQHNAQSRQHRADKSHKVSAAQRQH